MRSQAERGTVFPVCIEVLADTETPPSLLGKLRGEGGPIFLFESVEGGERWGRYSFLGRAPRLTVTVTREKVVIEEGPMRTETEHHGDPLPILRGVMARFTPTPQPELPRFWGGLVGYIAYEFVSFFEAIPNGLPEDAPLARFFVPSELYIFDNVRHTLMLVSYAFPGETGTVDAAFDAALERLDRMQAALALPTASESGTNGVANPEPILAPQAFRDQVSRIKEYIGAGDVIQTVISQPFTATPAPDPWLLYRAQRYVNPSPYLFYLDTGDSILVGSSPETMVRLENGVATLRPIAGTRPRGKTEQQDRRFADELLQDPKERAEHLMLVDLGRNDLGRVAEIGSVQVTDLMVVERYSHVMHLVSNITSDLETGRDAWDLLRASFPAGTLSGAPKIRAMEIIAELESDPRGAYGGAIGYVSFSGNMDLAITIRTAIIRDGAITVRAGAGIVADSDPETERQETINKARAIGRAIELIGRRNG